jgi:hypothetical protein
VVLNIVELVVEVDSDMLLVRLDLPMCPDILLLEPSQRAFHRHLPLLLVAPGRLGLSVRVMVLDLLQLVFQKALVLQESGPGWVELPSWKFDLVWIPIRASSLRL